MYEIRLLVCSKNDEQESNVSAIRSQSSKLSSLPVTFDYDTDTLKNELTQCGCHPGPITKTIKRREPVIPRERAPRWRIGEYLPDHTLMVGGTLNISRELPCRAGGALKLDSKQPT